MMQSKISVKKIHSTHEINQLLLSLCEQQQLDKRWIILFNTDKTLLKTLSAQKLPLTNKLLRVDNKHSHISLPQLPDLIDATRCSTLVVYAEAISSEEYALLQLKAAKAKMQIVIMQPSRQLH